jgi:hypothetical protein
LQIAWCRGNGAPFTGNIVEAVRDNLERGGALAALAVPWPGNPLADALALRIAGALHLMVRTGRAGELAAFYPPDEKPWNAQTAGRAIEAAVTANLDFVRDMLTRPPQTNEIGRSAVLMPGYAEIARATGLPLRILEVGASAGLNLLWDRYVYRYGERVVGAHDASVTVAAEWRGPWCGVERLPRVASREGCDRAPIDLAAQGAADRLVAYVWPEQSERLARLQAAVALALREKPAVTKADAVDWLERHLAAPVAGVASVVVHTIVWQYFSKEARTRAKGLIEGAGERATASAPLAWLSLEQYAPDQHPELRLVLWPGGERRTLARTHPHGAWIEWLDA